MPTRSILDAKPVQNGETFNLTMTIRDEAGAVVDLTDANVSGTITYFNDGTDTAINARNAQACITAGAGQNQHTVTAAGLLTWKAQIADTNLGLAADATVVARYIITFNDGAAVARTATHEVQFVIQPQKAIT